LLGLRDLYFKKAEAATVETARILGESQVEPAELRTLFLFEALADEHLVSLAAHSVLVEYDVGELIAEGDPARDLYVLVDGQIALSKRSAGREVETARTSHRGAYCGATASFIDEPPATYGFSVRTTRPTRLVRISADYFGAFVRNQYPLAVHLLQGVIVDHEGVHHVVDQQRRIEAVGTLTAGLMHGLNNPAGAIARISSQLESRMKADRQVRVYRELSPDAVQAYDGLRTEAVNALRAVTKSPLTAAQRLRREEEFEDWLTAQKIANSWEYAPSLAAGGVTVASLESATDTLIGPEAVIELSKMVEALTERIDTLLLIADLGAASAEVSALVASARHYSNLDSSPLAECDVHQLLDSTLTVMSAALDGGIAVERHYAPELPSLLCFAGELNQAWSNIVANAIDAIRATPERTGVISLRTSLVDATAIRVEIIDTGVGIDRTISDRVFLPFFTTKPVGQGVGMGLDLAWRTIVGLHRGSLSVESRPGRTCFTACLPLHPSVNGY
jgi:signal transduction histidine kinase